MFQSFLLLFVISVFSYAGQAEPSRALIHIPAGALDVSDCALSLKANAPQGGYSDVLAWIWPQGDQALEPGHSIQLSLSPELTRALIAKKGSKKQIPRDEEDFYRAPYRPGRDDRGKPGRNDSPDRAPDGAPVYYDPSSPSDFEIPPVYLLPVDIHYGGSLQNPEAQLGAWIYLD